MALAQDKRLQRERFAAAGLPVPPFRVVGSPADAVAFGNDHGWPMVLKAARGGYDGRGVWVLDDPATVGGDRQGSVGARHRADRRAMGADRAGAGDPGRAPAGGRNGGLPARRDGAGRRHLHGGHLSRRRYRRTACATRPTRSRRRSRRSRVWSASWRSSSSSPAAAWSSTRSRPGPTTPVTTRSKGARRRSSSSTCGRSSTGRSARPTSTAPAVVTVNVLGGPDGTDPACRLGRGARDRGSARPSLRQSAAAGPQAGPRHGPWRRPGVGAGAGAAGGGDPGRIWGRFRANRRPQVEMPGAPRLNRQSPSGTKNGKATLVVILRRHRRISRWMTDGVSGERPDSMRRRREWA